MQGIDVSSWNGWPFNQVTETAYKQSDFCIVKSTQGTSYTNPYFTPAIERCLKDGKLAGAYHYASTNNPKAEAEYFCKVVKPYIGKLLLCLDWESGSNAAWGSTSWCKTFVDRVKELCGITCVLYTGMDGSRQNQALANKVPLWFAGYPEQKNSWTPPKFPYSTSPWSNYDIWQFTSAGGIDRNTTAWTKDTWAKKAGKQMPSLKKFVERMDYWCRVASLGYDQANRWDIRDGGECDCSSLVIWCLNEAGFDTGEAPKLRGANPTKGASYTGNMSSYLTARGWKRLPYNVADAKTGDILLNDSAHVAAVIKGSGAGATIAQASIGDGGRVSGGASGDQANETNERGIYNYPWNCILRWGGTNDITTTSKAKTLQLYKQNGTDAQKFEIKPNGDYVVLKNKACGLVLDVANGKAEKGNPVQLYPSNGTDAQLWKLEKVGEKYSATYRIISKKNPSLVLDVKSGTDADGTAIQLWASNGTTAQLWYIFEDGTITLAKGSHRCLDAKGGGK